MKRGKEGTNSRTCTKLYFNHVTIFFAIFLSSRSLCIRRNLPSFLISMRLLNALLLIQFALPAIFCTSLEPQQVEKASYDDDAERDAESWSEDSVLVEDGSSDYDNVVVGDAEASVLSAKVLSEAGNYTFVSTAKLTCLTKPIPVLKTLAVATVIVGAALLMRHRPTIVRHADTTMAETFGHGTAETLISSIPVEIKSFFEEVIRSAPTVRAAGSQVVDTLDVRTAEPVVRASGPDVSAADPDVPTANSDLATAVDAGVSTADSDVTTAVPEVAEAPDVRTAFQDVSTAAPEVASDAEEFTPYTTDDHFLRDYWENMKSDALNTGSAYVDYFGALGKAALARLSDATARITDEAQGAFQSASDSFESLKIAGTDKLNDATLRIKTRVEGVFKTAPVPKVDKQAKRKLAEKVISILLKNSDGVSAIREIALATNIPMYCARSGLDDKCFKAWFRKVSLLIHPDKCTHSSASKATVILNNWAEQEMYLDSLHSFLSRQIQEFRRK